MHCRDCLIGPQFGKLVNYVGIDKILQMKGLKFGLFTCMCNYLFIFFEASTPWKCKELNFEG